ncbi:MAG: tetratricopeptide repeat protein [Vulcanimicrobiaceae bacterium]
MAPTRRTAIAPRAGLAVALWCGLAAAACAQPYPSVTPVPRTTDAAALHELARSREIDERIRIGFAAEQRGDWPAAAPEFERVMALEPPEPQGSTALYDLALAQAGTGSLDAAAASLRDAIARDPGFLAARANLVGVELMRGDLPAARAAADAFVAVAPAAARALYARGLVALRSGDAATARRDFATLLSHDPAYAVGHYDLALAETQLGNLSEAERELRAALGLAPEYARARVALGAVLLREGKRDEARSTFDEAARLAPDLALRNLAASLRDAIAP